MNLLFEILCFRTKHCLIRSIKLNSGKFLYIGLVEMQNTKMKMFHPGIFKWLPLHLLLAEFTQAKSKSAFGLRVRSLLLLIVLA